MKHALLDISFTAPLARSTRVAGKISLLWQAIATFFLLLYLRLTSPKRLSCLGSRACCGLCCCALLCTFPSFATACAGGFWGDYPRERILVPQADKKGEYARMLFVHGRNWRISTPSGLHDLESLTSATLPTAEIFKTMAFNLTPGTVYFTNHAGKAPWPAHSVPMTACLDIRPAAGTPRSSLNQAAPNGAPTSALSPEAFKKLRHYLAGEKVPPAEDTLDALIAEEINDRASLDLKLISMHSPEVTQDLRIEYNVNHSSALLNDSLYLSYRLHKGAWDITLTYTLPLEEKDTTAPELAQKILLLQQRMGTWLQTFCALNALDIPEPLWLWTRGE